MEKIQKISLLLLRVSLGWVFFYAGITKVLNPAWSAAGYLSSAKTFPNFFQWLTNPNILPFTNFINEWGLTLLGASLILGVGMKLSTILGAILMLLYYFPILEFPHIPEAHAYIVDEHIVYAITLIVLGKMRAGKIYSLESWFAKIPVLGRLVG